MMTKSKLLGITLAALMAALAGCADQLIKVHLGSEKVAVAQAGEVSACQPKGKVTVSVMSEVAFITRSPEAVEANLLQLARNSAVDSGADTVVKGSSTEFGKRSFDIYKCRP